MDQGIVVTPRRGSSEPVPVALRMLTNTFKPNFEKAMCDSSKASDNRQLVSLL